MMVSDIVLGIVFLIQIGVGILGNVFLLVIYSSILLTGHRLRPIECIFSHLALANSEVLLSKGIPLTIVCFGIKNFLDSAGCKFVIYLNAMARSVCLSITCLLSGFQVITISPRTSRWAELKTQAPKCIIPSCFFCWCFYLLINLTLLGTLHNLKHMTNNSKMWHLGYCSILIPDSFNATFFAIVFSIPDIICLASMIWASAYIMLLLHKHHQHVRHIHSSHLSPRTFPEKRATYSVLLLLSTYVTFYSINSSLSFYFFKNGKPHPGLMATSDFLAAWFPTISPFVLIFCDSQALKHWYALWHRRHSCLLCNNVPNHIPSQHSALTLTSKCLSEAAGRGARSVEYKYYRN
ncbi:vomeronasal type-1 receptor 4-like [Dromiciops gliroides]|uniref:vomeronasal type-1 receptor 4-like n=1 Tax=Dromiciops gliroides TaxID=33562 RepID=UPI001CC615FE|nr:vomeronasal type-1 receptor 4-like [Dromiciops gliroides]